MWHHVKSNQRNVSHGAHTLHSQCTLAKRVMMEGVGSDPELPRGKNRWSSCCTYCFSLPVQDRSPKCHSWLVEWVVTLIKLVLTGCKEKADME
jgi:hypothetical protein